MRKKRKGALPDYIKANRKGSREAELEEHGRPVNYTRVHVSKKVYNRKQYKADHRHLPYLFLVHYWFLTRFTISSTLSLMVSIAIQVIFPCGSIAYTRGMIPVANRA